LIRSASAHSGWRHFRPAAGDYKASDNYHNVTGYHGYWPVKARQVDPRIGGDAALSALVAEAHEHGIRILMDYVVNHVHQDHEYYQQHPDWFRTGCVCGTQDCDWTGKRLECLFTPYLPDVNWTVPEAGEQLVDDAVWWLDSFDLDGLRADAVSTWKTPRSTICPRESARNSKARRNAYF
jgi:glycosidase